MKYISKEQLLFELQTEERTTSEFIKKFESIVKKNKRSYDARERLARHYGRLSIISLLIREISDGDYDCSKYKDSPITM